jgi:hypothetical protein
MKCKAENEQEQAFHLDVDNHELMAAELPSPVREGLRRFFETNNRFNKECTTCGVLRRSSVQSWLLLYLGESSQFCRGQEQTPHLT